MSDVDPNAIPEPDDDEGRLTDPDEAPAEEGTEQGAG